MFIDYQEQAYNEIIKHDKSLIFWTRQTGKSFIINKTIENFILNNTHRKLLFIVDAKKWISDSIRKCHSDINNSYIIKKSKYSIEFINDNELLFCSIKESLDFILLQHKPDFILYDGFREIENNKENIFYINNYLNKINMNCKVLFTFLFDINIILLFDSKNDYYINIVPFYDSEISIIDCINPNTNKKLINLLRYKPYHLLDYYDLIYIRRKKILKINSI